MSNLSLALALLSSGLMLVLLGVLIRYKVYHRFPPFFAYCIFAPCANAVGLAVSKHPIPYFLTYWLTQSAYVLLAFVAMLSVLRPFTKVAYVSHPWSRFLLLPSLALLVFSSLWTGFIKPIDTTPIARFASAIYLFVIQMSIAEVTLYIISSRLRGAIQWTEQEFAILRGFGVLASINLVAYIALVLRLLHIRVGPQLEGFFQLGPSCAFLGSAIVWLMAFWKPEHTTEPPDIGRMIDAWRVLQEQLDADIEYVKEVARRLGLRLASA